MKAFFFFNYFFKRWNVTVSFKQVCSFICFIFSVAFWLLLYAAVFYKYVSCVLFYKGVLYCWQIKYIFYSGKCCHVWFVCQAINKCFLQTAMQFSIVSRVIFMLVICWIPNILLLFANSVGTRDSIISHHSHHACIGWV